MFIDEDIAYVVTTDFPTLVYIPSTIPIQKNFEWYFNCVCVPGGEVETWGNLFSTVWVWQIETILSGLVANTFSHWAIPMASNHGFELDRMILKFMTKSQLKQAEI